MFLIDPMTDSFEINYLRPVKKLLGIKPMGLSSPWADSLEIIVLKPVKNC